MRTTEIIYYLINALPAPIWAAWIFAPRSGWSRHFATRLWPWTVLCSAYVVLIGTAMFIVGGKPGASMFSLDGVMIIFDSEWTTLACWMHYLAFDTLAARFIVNDAPPSYRLSPILLLVLFFGPAGFLLYLLRRSVLRRAPDPA